MDRHSQVYIEFYELHRDSYESIVFFFEHHQPAIRQLPLEEQLELLAEYLNACFETGQYRKYLHHVDELIESLIMYTVDSDLGKKEYTKAIFRKAAALFNLEYYKESIHIVKQLCRMEPHNVNARLLYRRCLYNNLSTKFKYIRNGAAVAMLLSAVLTGVALIGGQYFQSAWVDSLNIVRNVTLATSLGVLMGLELRIRYIVDNSRS